MAHKEFLGSGSQPNIGFDANAAERKSFVQRSLSPVVIVRVALNGFDVAAEVVWPCELGRGQVRGLCRESLGRYCREPILRNQLLWEL